MSDKAKSNASLPNEEVQRYLREKRHNTLHWYVLYVTAQHERQVLEAFTGKADSYRTTKSPLNRRLPPLDPPIEAYVPIREERHKWSDRTRVVPIIMTPGIVFVRIKLAEKRRLYISDHIRSFLFDKDLREPASISDSVMEAFRSIVENAEDSTMQTPVPGDTVQIISGKFEGYVGEVVRREGQSHFQLRISEGIAITLRMEESMMKVVPKGTKRIIPDI